MKKILLLLAFSSALFACEKPSDEPVEAARATVMWCLADGKKVSDGATVTVDTSLSEITMVFSSAVRIGKGDKLHLSFTPDLPFSLATGPDSESLRLLIEAPLESGREYKLLIPKGEVFGVRLISKSVFGFATGYDSSDKFPRISRDSLLTLVEKQTFKYFRDYAHPVSGMARERLGSGETVTTGGSGFGLAAIVAAVHRGLISREEGYAQVLKITDFLASAESFHGVFPHWMNGSTGAAIPFSTYDDGADLVETAFLMEGLLACRNYFSGGGEAELRNKITALWEAVEWDWFERNDALYWHWSPKYGWQMNMKISGWNEGLIVYVLGASSPTHGISRSSYDNGWARGGGMRNGRQFYGITLPLGSDYGGPLFFAHYSFLGLDPRGLSDRYANYWEQNVAHARINQAYCVANPKGKTGYGAECWGLTASDVPTGYVASSPSNDNGVIAPTAALSSMPYTPDESIAAMEYFYYVLGDRLWGDYGFRDAFHLGQRWFAPSYLAIDQGPIVVMIENYRSGAVWDAFMKDPDVTSGLAKLGFSRQ